MNVYVSKAIINGARNDINNTYDKIAREKNSFDDALYKAEDKVKKIISKLQQAIYDLNKEIDLAKKVISDNQDVRFRLIDKMHQAEQKYNDYSWKLSQAKKEVIPEPKSTGDVEIDKKQREAYNQALRNHEEKIKSLTDSMYYWQERYNEIEKCIKAIEDAEVKLKRYINENTDTIRDLDYEIGSFKSALDTFKRSVYNFKDSINSILREINNNYQILNTASTYVNKAVDKFKEANISIADNEPIVIKNLETAINKLGKIKKLINDSYELGNQLNHKFMHSNQKLKDNIMTESGKVIIDIRRSCDDTIDSLRRMEEIVGQAMSILSSYVNL